MLGVSDWAQRRIHNSAGQIRETSPNGGSSKESALGGIILMAYVAK
jgi:hypothetical protein